MGVSFFVSGPALFMAHTTKTPSTDAWTGRIAKCKALRTQLIPDWQENVDFRRGKPFTDESDLDRVAINLDWPKTKAKHANLFSQVPEVRLSSENDELLQAAAVFAKRLNKTLRKSNVGAAVDEAVNDCINASGIGAAIVTYERRTEPKDVPTVDQATAQQMQAIGLPVPTERVDSTTDAQFTNRRFSPTDLLWPAAFTGSDFDDADWIGRSGLMTWAEAKNEFKLQESDKDSVIGATSAPDDNLKDDASQRTEDDDMVEFDEVFYWAYRFDPQEKSFSRIKRLVFISGKEKPVVDGDWTGQRLDPETGQYLGSRRFPIRVLTLTYISDDCIPPSDTRIGRPQVLELIESHSNTLLQRQRSVPIRGFDVTKVDPEVQTKLMDGTWQGMIPMNGSFQNAIWEVARANYPREDMEFDRIANKQHDDVWGTSANQAGSFASSERSASEANIVQQNFQTRVGYERGRVAAFFLGIAEVQAGLLALYGDFETPGWDRTKVHPEFVFSILPDSTVILDANQKIERKMGVLNMLGKSGLINPEPLVMEIAELAGSDPTKLAKPPQQPPTEKIKISISSAEDLINPLMLALLMSTDQAPSPEHLEAAKKLLITSQLPPAPEPPADPNAPPQDPNAPPPDMGMNAPPMGEAPPVGPDGNPENWNQLSKVTKRSDYDG